MAEEAVRLNKLYDAYAEKGFRMVVISPHKVSDLRSELVEQHNAKYWIGSDSRLRTLIDYVVPNTVAEFPMTYLVDARGTVVDHGRKLETKIEYLLQEVFEPELGRELHAELAAARKDFDEGAIGAAWQSAGRHLEAGDAQLVADARFLRERSEAYGAWKKLMLERQIAAGVLPESVRALKKMEKQTFTGMPVAQWAATRRAELEKDPKVKMESVIGVMFVRELGRELHPELKSARRHYDRESIGSAWKFAGKKLESEDLRLVEDAKFLRERCEAYGEWHRYTAMHMIQEGDYPKAVARLKELTRTFKGMPTGDWAAERRRELLKDPQVKLEITAWARLEKALAKATKARGDPRKMRSVHKEYEAIRDKYPGTRAAEEAAKRLNR